MNYGEFGGQYVPQELKEKLNEIEREFTKQKMMRSRKGIFILFKTICWKTNTTILCRKLK